MKQTDLEYQTLALLSKLHGDKGFPQPESIRVLSRVNTGSGRFVSLESEVLVGSFSGYLDLEGSFIEMDGIEDGMMAAACIDAGVLSELEFAVYGDSGWDGEERLWRFVGPEG